MNNIKMELWLNTIAWDPTSGETFAELAADFTIVALRSSYPIVLKPPFERSPKQIRIRDHEGILSSEQLSGYSQRWQDVLFEQVKKKFP